MNKTGEIIYKTAKSYIIIVTTIVLIIVVFNAIIPQFDTVDSYGEIFSKKTTKDIYFNCTHYFKDHYLYRCGFFEFIKTNLLMAPMILVIGALIVLTQPIYMVTHLLFILGLFAYFYIKKQKSKKE